MNKPRTASQLAGRVLKHPRGGIAALLALADGSERDWLEFKAATYPIGGDFKTPENKHDYRWNVAKAVIALANTIGGVVLLGVNDAGEPVGIEASDPDKKRERDGAEAFRRDVVLQQVLHPKRGWRTGTEGHIEVVNPALYESLIKLEEVRFGGRIVIAILVDSVPRGYGHILVSKNATHRSDPIVYVRRRGSIGQVREVSVHDPVLSHSHNGQPESFESEARQLWDLFLARLQGPRRVGELEPRILAHLDRTKSQLSPFEHLFTPLDGVQREPPLGERVAASSPLIPELGEEWLGKPGQPNSETNEAASDLVGSDDAPRSGLVMDLLDRQRRASLIGEAGSGKSTCLRTFALSTAKQWERGRPWPIFASLAQYSSEGLPALLQRSSGIDWEDLAPEVASGEVVLCLDALNQCPDSLYESCGNEIANMLVEYPELRMLISSRSASDVEQFGLPSVEIRPLDSSQQIRFLQAYISEHGRAADVLDRLCQQPGGNSIAGSPILLRIVAEIARESSVLPTGRAALYRRFLEVWCQREIDQALLRGDLFPWSREQVMDALSSLAFRARRRGWSTLSVDQVSQIMIPLLGKDVDRFIDQMAQGFTLTRDEQGGTVGFWHETIQEYLCAEYLVARHQDLGPNSLEVHSASRRPNWATVLAFAFELIDEPSDALMVAAWHLDPLITMMAARDSTRLASVPIEGDPWTRAILRALRGEDVSKETMEVTIAARLPPKYPISPYLISTLQSSAFWYAADSHEAGTSRLDLLLGLLSGGRFPWIELLSDALAGNPTWQPNLSPAQRLLVGVEAPSSLSEVLSTATVAELCALRRRGKISAGTFLSSWEHALGDTSGVQLEVDLIDILRTEREKVRENVRRMLVNYRATLRQIAADRRLSLRLLSILVREKVISAREIRSDRDRLQDILVRMSVMNAIRLAKCRVIARSDIDERDRTRLIYESSQSQIASGVEVGLFVLEDLPPALRAAVMSRPTKRRSRSGESAHGPRYLVADLVDVGERTSIDRLLRARRWKVTVKWVHPEGIFGFVEHPAFDADIFFATSAIASSDGAPIAAGQMLDARLVTRFDRSKDRWAFAIDSGQVVDSGQCC
jgi:cold shock CspA family protein